MVVFHEASDNETVGDVCSFKSPGRQQGTRAHNVKNSNNIKGKLRKENNEDVRWIDLSNISDIR